MLAELSGPGYLGRPLAEASGGCRQVDSRRPLRAAGAMGAASPRGSRPRSPGKPSGPSTAASFRCLLSRGRGASCPLELGVNPGSVRTRALRASVFAGVKQRWQRRGVWQGREGTRPIIFTSVFFLFLLTTQQAPAGAEGSRKFLLEVFPFVAASPGISPQVALNVLGFCSKSVLSEKLPAAQGGRTEGCAGRAWRVSRGWRVGPAGPAPSLLVREPFLIFWVPHTQGSRWKEREKAEWVASSGWVFQEHHCPSVESGWKFARRTLFGWQGFGGFLLAFGLWRLQVISLRSDSLTSRSWAP